MSLEHLENAVNEVSDKDWSWWPFLWLRPEKHEPMTLTRLATVAFLFGAPIGAFLTVVGAMVNPEAKYAAPVLLAIFPLLLFFVASVVVGPMWNRRAERLRARAKIE
ncbi:MAG: hypothetical protein KIT84_05940 [Labilithrix sp.]|nr:hypothetical protein [Labilithrix sp.]MCW5810531.1 hypothetical protein [Labilithrix sp.]